MFNHLRMEQQVREAGAQGARLRVRGAFWSAASVALAVPERHVGGDEPGYARVFGWVDRADRRTDA